MALSKEDLFALEGTDFGTSDWLQIDQDRINKFAEATNDPQFIHVDPERAAETPFGTTIAHGFLTLSLVSYLTSGLLKVPEGTDMVINYGLNKVRFLMPVKVNQHLRAHMENIEITEKRPGQILIRSTVTLEIKEEDKPACIAESMALVFVGE